MPSPESGRRGGARLRPPGAGGRIRGRGALGRWAGPIAVFAVAFLGFGALYAGFPVLYDVDSYYHLGVARLYGEAGIVEGFPWARFSLFRDGFGDKEVLFHLLLVPFAGGEEPERGGRWALAVLGALVAATLASLGQAASGRWGLVLAPLLVFAGSTGALGRIVRLRPELLGLVLLLAAAWCAGRDRFRLSGAVAFAYTLAYTAFQALLGLAAAWLVVRGLRRREWRPELLLYPLLGCGLALLLHPQFPHNLVVWKVQNVDFFRLKSTLDVGSEIRPPSPLELLREDGPWLVSLLALAVAAVAGRRRRQPHPLDGLVETTGTAAVAFAALYLLAIRFSIYAVPFATLALLFVLRKRNGGPIELRTRRARVTAAVLAVALGWGALRAGTLLAGMRAAHGPLPRETDWAAAAQALPPSARVAADWGNGELFFFWAPHATYLNVLDPVFMAVPYPDAHRALRRLLDGVEPDVPLVVARDLASDHLLLSALHPTPLLPRRLAGDPRLVPVYDRLTRLFRVEPAGADAFVRDWKVAPPGASFPPDPAAVETWPPWPRSEDPEARAVEAFVDLRRLDGEARCTLLAHPFTLEAPASPRWELAPWEPARAWLDGRPLAEVREARLAVLGTGITLAVDLAAGPHVLAVETCRVAETGDEGAAVGGFFLRRLGQ